jgi:hypothetical protein
MKSNKIIFKAQDHHVAKVRTKPVPASQYIPQWWKDIPKYSNESNKFEMDPGPSVTVKQCAPMFDGLVSGYIIPLWTDILVTREKGTPKIQWSNQVPAMSVWNGEQSGGVEIPEGFGKEVFKYLHGWTIKTPPGWSIMFVHPVGYPNLPIRALPGIVDTDILDTEINCPFVIKNNFEGIIQKGTPIVQMIPIQRSNWVAEYEEMSPGEHFINVEKMLTKLYGHYRSIRETKSYK